MPNVTQAQDRIYYGLWKSITEKFALGYMPQIRVDPMDVSAIKRGIRKERERDVAWCEANQHKAIFIEYNRATEVMRFELRNMAGRVKDSEM